jgi:hypothetical protein
MAAANSDGLSTITFTIPEKMLVLFFSGKI